MINLIQEKLRSYSASNRIEEENAIKEIMQEIALYGLWRADFFETAVFQGGTSLRILHALPRFSEGLDFMLIAPDPDFDWAPYLDALMATFETFGIKPEARAKGAMDKRIRAAVLKDTSVVNQLDLAFAGRQTGEKITIKLEIDVEPPVHSKNTWTYLDFPTDYEVQHQDLASNFALKIHALLCRGFLKGRDWYDFSWYVSRGVSPNLVHLEAALKQFGPWSDDAGLTVDKQWIEQQLSGTISSINWDEAKKDVRRFLKPAELKSLELWSERFFLTKLQRLIETPD
ncbi:MAG: nucleotidyl transferase AbiEii/AbiGii toxin family protein [Hyphomonas sp.]|uniref:nucleotidyl transferase AbiEii/AbiGii toxin family protein n=1 Tax=Hyphomonas sp. TaxID=87 RepID=UPI0034A00AF3